MKKIVLILLFISLFFLNIYADKPKYVFLVVCDGMSVSNEIALSNFLYGQGKQLTWNTFPVQMFMTAWSINSYRGTYSENNFDSENGYDTNLAGTMPYPYYKSEQAERYFKDSVSTDYAAAATAMSTGKKVYNNGICYDTKTDKVIENITDKINEKKEYNVALVTTDNFYNYVAAGFLSHNKSKNNYNEIAEEILSKTKPEIIVGQNDIYEMNKVAASNGYYVLDYPEINEPQVFNLLNKKIFVRLKNYFVPYPIEYFTLESFVYRNIDTKFSSVVSDTTRLLLKKNKPFFMLVEITDVGKANCENDYNKMLGAMYELNETIKEIYDLINSKYNDMSFDNSIIIVVSSYSAGMLRFNAYLPKGNLPRPNILFNKKTIIKADTNINYKTKYNVNELVGCYSIGAKSNLFNKYINEKNIIDNTDIYNILSDIFVNN